MNLLGNNLLSGMSYPFRETFWYRFEDQKVPLVIPLLVKRFDDHFEEQFGEQKVKHFGEQKVKQEVNLFEGTVWGTE